MSAYSALRVCFDDEQQNYRRDSAFKKRIYLQFPMAPPFFVNIVVSMFCI